MSDDPHEGMDALLGTATGKEADVPAGDKPDDAGVDHAVPAELTELHEVIEWERTIDAEAEEAGT